MYKKIISSIIGIMLLLTACTVTPKNKVTFIEGPKDKTTETTKQDAIKEQAKVEQQLNTEGLEVNFLSPTQDSINKGQINVNFSINDQSKITKIELYDGSIFLDTISKTPFSWNWNSSQSTDGIHELIAKIFTKTGKIINKSIKFIINNLNIGILFTNPINNAIIGRTLILKLSLLPNTATPSKIEIYVDGNLLTTFTTLPYEFQWDTTKTTNIQHVLKAKIFKGTEINEIGVSFNVDNILPILKIESPTEDSTLDRTNEFKVMATDESGIDRVEFYDGQSLLFSDNIFPYTYQLDAQKIGGGEHLLKAVAYDTAGNSQSQIVKIKVNGPILPSSNPTSSPSGSGTGNGQGQPVDIINTTIDLK